MIPSLTQSTRQFTPVNGSRGVGCEVQYRGRSTMAGEKTVGLGERRFAIHARRCVWSSSDCSSGVRGGCCGCCSCCGGCGCCCCSSCCCCGLFPFWWLWLWWHVRCSLWSVVVVVVFDDDDGDDDDDDDDDDGDDVVVIIVGGILANILL